MISKLTMGNATNHLSLCVRQSSRKTRRERPYVSRPCWPYEHENRLNASQSPPSNSPIRLSPTALHENPQSRSIHIIKKTACN